MLVSNKLENIKTITGYSLDEIKEMSSIVFFQKITGLMMKGIITTKQHDWLVEQRNGSLQQIIDIFGGHEVK